MKVASVGEMRNMDRRVVEELSIPEEILMENAALAACFLLSRDGGVKGRHCAVLCGPGNNGGDGLALARLLLAGGAHVDVFIAGDEKKFRGAARSNLEIIRRLPVGLNPVVSAESVRSSIMQSHIIVDALLGTGLDREVGGLIGDLIGLVNESGKTILSLDIPSGINGNSGEAMGIAVKADSTVTFGLPKIGNLLYPGYGHCGRLYVSRISFPPVFFDDQALKIQTNDRLVLPARPPEAHKGLMGRVLIIAGSANYYGAPYFSSFAFLKAGGGYVYLAAPRSIIPVVAGKGSEIVFLPQEENAAGGIALANRTGLLEATDKADVVVVGPGLSLAEETRQLVKELAAAIRKPLLIDGDGITALADNPDIFRQRPAVTAITPHLGEMARITGKTADLINRRKIPVLQETAERLRAMVVLKGAHSLIGAPDGRVFINLSGNPGMATAGAGDVLNGAVAAMFGLGLPWEEAVRKGVFIHGFAGDLATADKGEDGVTARDILEYLPAAVKHDRDGAPAGYEIPLI